MFATEETNNEGDRAPKQLSTLKSVDEEQKDAEVEDIAEATHKLARMNSLHRSNRIQTFDSAEPSEEEEVKKEVERRLPNQFAALRVLSKKAVKSDAEGVVDKAAHKNEAIKAPRAPRSPKWTHTSQPTTVRDFDERIAEYKRQESARTGKPVRSLMRKKSKIPNVAPFVAVTMDSEELSEQFPAGIYRVELPVQLRTRLEVTSIPVCRLKKAQLVTVSEVSTFVAEGKRCVRAHVTSPTTGWTSLISTSLKRCLKLEIAADNEELQELANRSRVKNLSIAERQHTKKSRARQIRRTTELQQLATEADRRAKDLFENPPAEPAPAEKEKPSRSRRTHRGKRKSRRSRRRRSRANSNQSTTKASVSTRVTTRLSVDSTTTAHSYNPIMYSDGMMSGSAGVQYIAQPVVYQVPQMQYAPMYAQQPMYASSLDGSAECQFIPTHRTSSASGYMTPQSTYAMSPQVKFTTPTFATPTFAPASIDEDSCPLMAVSYAAQQLGNMGSYGAANNYGSSGSYQPRTVLGTCSEVNTIMPMFDDNSLQRSSDDTSQQRYS